MTQLRKVSRLKWVNLALLLLIYVCAVVKAIDDSGPRQNPSIALNFEFNTAAEKHIDKSKRPSFRPSYMVHFKRSAEQSGIDALVEEVKTKHVSDEHPNFKAHVKHQYKHTHRGICVHEPSTEAKSFLENHDLVERIAPDQRRYLLSSIRSHSSGGVPYNPWHLDRANQLDLPLDGDRFSTSMNLTGQGVNMFVLDSGVDTGHYEFGGSGRTATNIFDVNFPSDTSTNNDVDGHGTHVAGIAAGLSVGIAPGVNVYGLKVTDDSGSAFSSDIVAGLDYILDLYSGGGEEFEGVPSVIQMSIGGPCTSSLDETFTGCNTDTTAEDVDIEFVAAEAVHEAGIPFVVAAGNSRCDGCYFSPGASPHTISVGATDRFDGEMAFFLDVYNLYDGGSEWGRCVDIFAPGANITSACNQDQCGDLSSYTILSGTSMAAPYVSGIIALLLEGWGPNGGLATRDGATDGVGYLDTVEEIREALLCVSAAGGVLDLGRLYEQNFLTRNLIAVKPSVLLNSSMEPLPPDTCGETIAYGGAASSTGAGQCSAAGLNGCNVGRNFNFRDELGAAEAANYTGTADRDGVGGYNTCNADESTGEEYCVCDGAEPVYGSGCGIGGFRDLVDEDTGDSVDSTSSGSGSVVEPRLDPAVKCGEGEVPFYIHFLDFFYLGWVQQLRYRIKRLEIDFTGDVYDNADKNNISLAAFYYDSFYPDWQDRYLNESAMKCGFAYRKMHCLEPGFYYLEPLNVSDVFVRDFLIPQVTDSMFWATCDVGQGATTRSGFFDFGGMLDNFYRHDFGFFFGVVDPGNKYNTGGTGTGNAGRNRHVSDGVNGWGLPLNFSAYIEPSLLGDFYDNTCIDLLSTRYFDKLQESIELQKGITSVSGGNDDDGALDSARGRNWPSGVVGLSFGPGLGLCSYLSYFVLGAVCYAVYSLSWQ